MEFGNIQLLGFRDLFSIRFLRLDLDLVRPLHKTRSKSTFERIVKIRAEVFEASTV